MSAFIKRFRDWILCVGILGTIGGAICIVFLPGMWWRAEAIANSPRQLTVQELIAKGNGDNPHIVVSDFTCGNGYVFKIKSSKYNNEPLHQRTGIGQAWIPLFPKRPREADAIEAPEPPNFVVLLQTESTSGNATDFHLLSRRPSMTGLVYPYRRSWISSEVHSKLKAAYPATDFQKCLIFEQFEGHGKSDTILFSYALLVGAIAGPLVGVPALIAVIRTSPAKIEAPESGVARCGSDVQLVGANLPTNGQAP